MKLHIRQYLILFVYFFDFIKPTEKNFRLSLTGNKRLSYNPCDKNKKRKILKYSYFLKLIINCTDIGLLL